MDLITIDKKICRRDGIRREVCPYALFEADLEGYPVLRSGGAERCIACGHCVAICPHAALDHAALFPTRISSYSPLKPPRSLLLFAPLVGLGMFP